MAHDRRKADHIRINLEENVQFPGLTNGFECYRLTHQALPELNLTEISVGIGLSKSTTHRLLSTLEATGMVEFDKRTAHYRLGLKAFRLGSVVVKSMELVKQGDPLLAAIAEETSETAFLVVSDGNVDGTQYEASAVPSDRLTVLHYAGNAGKAFALRYGMNHARADYIAFVDVDLSLSALGIANLYHQLLEDDCDVVVGSKFDPDSTVEFSGIRSVQQRVFGWLVRSLFDLPVLDTQTGVRVFRRKVLDDVMPQTRSKGFAFDIELLHLADQAGYRIEEGPIKLQYRLPAVLGPRRLVGAVMTFVRLAVIRWRFLRPRRKTSRRRRMSG